MTEDMYFVSVAVGQCTTSPHKGAIIYLGDTARLNWNMTTSFPNVRGAMDSWKVTRLDTGIPLKS